jgi:hypothetical protein
MERPIAGDRGGTARAEARSDVDAEPESERGSSQCEKRTM